MTASDCRTQPILGDLVLRCFKVQWLGAQRHHAWKDDHRLLLALGAPGVESMTLWALHWNLISPGMDIHIGPDKLGADNLVSGAMDEDEVGVMGDACGDGQELTQWWFKAEVLNENALPIVEEKCGCKTWLQFIGSEHDGILERKSISNQETVS